jgi:hypothetical protein
MSISSPPEARHEGFHSPHGLLEGETLLNTLTEKILHPVDVFQRPVYFRIASGLVRTDVDQILGILEHGEDFPYRRGRRHLLLRNHAGHHAADASEDIHRRVVVSRGDLAGENDVSVENAPHRVRHGLVHVIALHENRVDGGDASPLSRAGPLKKTGQKGEHRRRVPACGGRLPHGQS